MQRNFVYLEERLEQQDGLTLMEMATVLEDAIDIHDRHWKIHWMLNFAQLSATLNLRAVMQRIRGSVDDALLGRLQNSAKDRNWDSIEALWKMKEEAKADAELSAAFNHSTPAEVISALEATRPRPPLHRRPRQALPARVRLARRVEPRVHLPQRVREHGAGHPARQRLPRYRLRLSEDSGGPAGRHRRCCARDP